MADEPSAIDRHGDLRLKVGSPQQAGDTLCQSVEFLVCSRALARASPVFDRMLYGAFAEASHNQEGSEGWTVELKEDKPAAMEVFLNVAHANFARVPHVLSVDGLYDVAVLTHYYDATRLLAPWVGSWMASIVEMTRDANVIMPKMLWISWEFGRKEDFIAVARRMLMEAKTPWAMEPDSGDDAVQTPPHIVERINTLRVQTIQELLDIVKDLVTKLMVVDEEPRWCRHATYLGHHRCESMLLGSITFCLARAGLWPLPEAVDVELSLFDLYRVLATLVIHDIGKTNEKPAVDHQDCNPSPQLLNQVQMVMGQIPSPLTDFHVKHLEEQAQRLKHGAPT
ncbi:nuclear pore protein-like protein [Metarhizium brunneum]